MNWKIGIGSEDPIATLQHLGLLAAAVLALAVTIVAIRRRRRHAQQNGYYPNSARSPEQLDADKDTPAPLADLDESMTQTSMVDEDDLTLDDIPPFSSLPAPNEGYERAEAIDTTSGSDTTDKASTLLFKLLSTKARICELERAEQNNTLIMESTCEILKRLQGSLKDSSPELQEEIKDMRDLMDGARLASRQSFESALELKEIIDMQCGLLRHGGRDTFGDFSLSEQSYIDRIDASLERRLKVAERRESELTLGKERIMALRRQLLQIKDASPDATQSQSKTS